MQLLHYVLFFLTKKICVILIHIKCIIIIFFFLIIPTTYFTNYYVKLIVKCIREYILVKYKYNKVDT